MNNKYDIESIRNSLLRLEEYIVKEKYKGYDPFDILKSPFFRFPILRSSKKIRLVFQQVFKRLPLNFRSLLFVEKGINPVTLGLCLQAFCYLTKLFPDKEEMYNAEINFCIDNLKKMSSSGFSGACWGYDFDWEARYATMPAFTPTNVATGFITNALFNYYKITGNKKAFELCQSSAEFVLNDLNKSFEGDSFCYSYSPLDKQKVLNATMKGARLLIQVYSETKEVKLKEEAGRTVAFVMDHQMDDGAWSYSIDDARSWVDNFHTGYILDCLEEYIVCSGGNEYESNLKKGIEYYVKNFFSKEGIPKYYNKSTYPIDSTAAAQSILSLSRFSYFEEAVQVSKWMIQNMQSKEGFFYFQKHKFYKNKIDYMRWSNAWMLLALSYLIYKMKIHN